MPGPAHQAGGEQLAAHVAPGLLDAVGGHEDGPGKGRELLALVLPGSAVVAVEVVIGLELGIGVAGQHLAVGVHVNALALALLQQLLQVHQVVARNQDGLARLVAQGHLGGHGMAIGPGVARVQ